MLLPSPACYASYRLPSTVYLAARHERVGLLRGVEVVQGALGLGVEGVAQDGDLVPDPGVGVEPGGSAGVGEFAGEGRVVGGRGGGGVLDEGADPVVGAGDVQVGAGGGEVAGGGQGLAEAAVAVAQGGVGLQQQAGLADGAGPVAAGQGQPGPQPASPGWSAGPSASRVSTRARSPVPKAASARMARASGSESGSGASTASASAGRLARPRVSASARREAGPRGRRPGTSAGSPWPPPTPRRRPGSGRA